MSRTTPQLPAALANADNLPTPPVVAMKVLRVADDPKSDASDLGDLIRTDPALAARLLRSANSAASGLSRRVDSIERACALLGFQKTKTLALGFAAAEAMPSPAPDSGMDLQEFWMRSGLTASGAELIARRLIPNDADVAFVVGLLSELGRLVLASCLTTIYGGLLREHPWPSPACERHALGFSNLEVTAGLLGSWNLPDEIVLPIAHRGASETLPDDAPPMAHKLCNILSAAESLADAWVSGKSGPGMDHAAEACHQYLSMPEDVFADLVVELDAKVQSSEAFANVSPQTGVNIRAIETEAGERLKEAVAISSTTSRLTLLLRSNAV